MSKYYIYKQFFDRKIGNTINVQRSIRYTLSRTPGEFFGEGNFCGYYSVSGFRGCEIIADEVIDVNTDNSEFDVFTYSIVKYDPPITYVVDDTYTLPHIFEASTDSEAIEIYIKFCEDKLKEEENE